MSTPLWRQMYNAWESAVSPGLQEITASTGFRDLMATAMKTNADITREIERSSRQLLHLLNLPAATDVRRLRQQVTGLEREIMALRHELERQTADPTDRAEGPTDAPQASASTPKPARRPARNKAEGTALASTNGSRGRNGRAATR